MKTTKLLAGAARQVGDEFRRTVPYGALGPKGCGDDKNYTNWTPVKLLGQIILQSDLIVCEFRRSI